MRIPNLRAPSVTRWVAVGSACLVFIRFFVLFCESFSVVRSERLADADLLELCGRGAAADSQKFRTLCLQAKAERAAPLLFKAVLRAMRTAFHDFADSVNSPMKIVILILFVVSGLALPVVKAVSSLAAAHLAHFEHQTPSRACTASRTISLTPKTHPKSSSSTANADVFRGLADCVREGLTHNAHAR